MRKRLQVRVLLCAVVRMEEEDEGCGVCRGVPHKRLAQRERMEEEEEDEGCGVGRGVPHKRLAQHESGVDGGDDVVAVWV